MAVKTFTGSTLFGPIPDRNSYNYSLTIIKQTELVQYLNLPSEIYHSYQ